MIDDGGDEGGDDAANGKDEVMVTMVILLMLYQGLIGTGLHSRCFRYIASYPHYSLKRWSLFFLFCRGGSWGWQRGMESLLGAGKAVFEHTLPCCWLLLLRDQFSNFHPTQQYSTPPFSVILFLEICHMCQTLSFICIISFNSPNISEKLVIIPLYKLRLGKVNEPAKVIQLIVAGPKFWPKYLTSGPTLLTPILTSLLKFFQNTPKNQTSLNYEKTKTNNVSLFCPSTPISLIRKKVIITLSY